MTVHPAHVAEFVAGEVEELRARTARSGLPIAAVELENETLLYVSLDLVRRRRVQVFQQPAVQDVRDGGLLHAVGAGVASPAGVLIPGGRAIPGGPAIHGGPASPAVAAGISPVAVAANIGAPMGAFVGNVPDLAHRPESIRRVLYCQLDDFDSQAPTAELLDENRMPLAAEEWPADPKGAGLVLGHPQWNRWWFCRKGFREFHSHPEHEDEPWDELRGAGVTLHGLVLGLVSDLTDRFIL